MKTVLINAGLEYHEPQTTARTSMPNSTSPPSPASMMSPIHLELTPCDSISTTTSMNKTCLLNTSCDHQLHLDHPSTSPEVHANKILESYERMFKEKPRKSRPPLEGGDHPELDTSELCDEHKTKQFQTLIGQLQWLNSLGCFDIAVHVMSLSRFRAQPRKVLKSKSDQVRQTDCRTEI